MVNFPHQSIGAHFGASLSVRRHLVRHHDVHFSRIFVHIRAFLGGNYLILDWNYCFLPPTTRAIQFGGFLHMDLSSTDFNGFLGLTPTVFRGDHPCRRSTCISKNLALAGALRFAPPHPSRFDVDFVHFWLLSSILSVCGTWVDVDGLMLIPSPATLERRRLRRNETARLRYHDKNAKKKAKKDHVNALARVRNKRSRDRKRAAKLAAMNPPSPSPAKGNKDGGADYSPVKTPPGGYPSPNHRRGSGRLRRSPRSTPRRHHRKPRTPVSVRSKQSIAMVREAKARKRKMLMHTAKELRAERVDRQKLVKEELAARKEVLKTELKTRNERNDQLIDMKDELIEEEDELIDFAIETDADNLRAEQGLDYDSEFTYDSELDKKPAATSPCNGGFDEDSDDEDSDADKKSFKNPPNPSAAAASWHSPNVVNPPAAAKLPSPKNENQPPSPPSSVLRLLMRWWKEAQSRGTWTCFAGAIVPRCPCAIGIISKQSCAI